MLKIVVFDSGYGGELFADRLEEELPVVDVIRVIDWRNAERIQKSPRAARKVALEALRPYIGRVDLIVLANHLLTVTSLKYFKRKYQGQKFVGMKLPLLDNSAKRPTVILTTKALRHTINYYNYLFRLGRKVDTLCLDNWLGLIDDGELTTNMVYREFENFRVKYHYQPTEVILTCSHFNDAAPFLKKVLGGNLKIYESYSDTIVEIYKVLKIRGGTGRKKK